MKTCFWKTTLLFYMLAIACNGTANADEPCAGCFAYSGSTVSCEENAAAAGEAFAASVLCATAYNCNTPAEHANDVPEYVPDCVGEAPLVQEVYVSETEWHRLRQIAQAVVPGVGGKTAKSCEYDCIARFSCKSKCKFLDVFPFARCEVSNTQLAGYRVPDWVLGTTVCSEEPGGPIGGN